MALYGAYFSGGRLHELDPTRRTNLFVPGLISTPHGTGLGTALRQFARPDAAEEPNGSNDDAMEKR